MSGTIGQTKEKKKEDFRDLVCVQENVFWIPKGPCLYRLEKLGHQATSLTSLRGWAAESSTLRGF